MKYLQELIPGCNTFTITKAEVEEYINKEIDIKISNFTPTIVKCGFPCSSLEKYEKLFKACNLNIKIIETEKNILYTLKDYSLDQNITKLLKSIKLININSLSIQEAYSFLEELQKDVSNLA